MNESFIVPDVFSSYQVQIGFRYQNQYQNPVLIAPLLNDKHKIFNPNYICTKHNSHTAFPAIYYHEKQFHLNLQECSKKGVYRLDFWVFAAASAPQPLNQLHKIHASITSPTRQVNTKLFLLDRRPEELGCLVLSFIAKDDVWLMQM